MADTRRLNAKPQDLTDAYGPPSNFLEIDIFNPQTVGMGRARYTSYELRMRVRPSRGPGRAARQGVSAAWAGGCGPTKALRLTAVRWELELVGLKRSGLLWCRRCLLSQRGLTAERLSEELGVCLFRLNSGYSC